MNKKQQWYIQDQINECEYIANQLREKRKSGIKLTQIEKSNLDYYDLKLVILSNIQAELEHLK